MFNLHDVQKNMLQMFDIEGQYKPDHRPTVGILMIV